MMTRTFTTLVLIFGAIFLLGCRLGGDSSSRLATQDAMQQQQENIYAGTIPLLGETARQQPASLSLCELDHAINVQIAHVITYDDGFTLEQRAAVKQYVVALRPHALEFARKLLAAHKSGQDDDDCIPSVSLHNGLFIVDSIYQALHYTGQSLDSIRQVLSAEEEMRMSVEGARMYVALMRAHPRINYYCDSVLRVVRKYNLTEQQVGATKEEWAQIVR